MVAPGACLGKLFLVIIRSGTSTAFSTFDSYVERNLPDLVTNQAKILSIHRKMTVAVKFLET